MRSTIYMLSKHACNEHTPRPVILVNTASKEKGEAGLFVLVVEGRCPKADRCRVWGLRKNEM